MIQTLQNIIKSKMLQNLQYKQSLKPLLLFSSPYQCLRLFSEKMQQLTSISLSTSTQNKSLNNKNKSLTKQLYQIKSQSEQRIKKQQQIIQELNNRIDQKKLELIKLEQSYQDLLKAKILAEKELNQTRELMKILRLKLYQEQREKLTEIVIANKKEIMDFRRTMEMDAYKMEMEFRRDIDIKDKEIKLLTKNIQELATNSLTSTSDLTVLQQIVKPMRQTTSLKQQIQQLRRELSLSKQQTRQKHSIILSLQSIVADITLGRENFKSFSSRLQIEKSLLQGHLKQTEQILSKSQNDKKAMELYYNEKWTHQFDKVKDKLEDKYKDRIKSLEIQFAKKKKQVQMLIQVYVQKIRIIKIQLDKIKHQNQILSIKNKALTQQNNHLSQACIQIKRTFIQSNCMHHEQILQLQRRSIQKYLYLEIEKKKINSQKDSLQRQYDKYKIEFEMKIQNISKFHASQRQNLQKQQKKIIQQQKQNYLSQINGLQQQYSNIQITIQRIKYEQEQKSIQNQHQLSLLHESKLHQQQHLYNIKLQKLQQKLSNLQIKHQQLRKKKQDDFKQSQEKKSQLNKAIHDLEVKIVSRDVQIQEFRNMKNKYMNQIQALHQSINSKQFQINTLQVQLAGKVKHLIQIQQNIKDFATQKLKFRADIKQLQKSYKTQFEQLKRTNAKQVNFYKSKLWQLQTLFQKRPIRKKDYQAIQNLQKQNQQLLSQMQLKQAQNLIIKQVKSYYQTKATLPNQPCSIFIKKPTKLLIKKPSRNNVLLSSTMSRMNLNYSNDQNLSKQLKEVIDMRRYLSRQAKNQSQAMIRRTEKERTMSSIA